MTVDTRATGPLVLCSLLPGILDQLKEAAVAVIGTFPLGLVAVLIPVLSSTNTIVLSELWVPPVQLLSLAVNLTTLLNTSSYTTDIVGQFFHSQLLYTLVLVSSYLL